MPEITIKDVEDAIDDLRKLGADAEQIYKEARLKEGMLKRTHALQAKMSNQKAVEARRIEAFASEKYEEALNEDAIAFANRQMHEHAWDLNKTIIGVWQSKVKDRT